MHRGFRIACFVFSIVAWLVACSGNCAHAAELHWQVPEGCPDVQALEQETERVLGGALAQYALEVNAVVTRAAAQLSLSLRITLPNSAEARERELQAASCQELLEATAVAIALAAANSGEPASTAVAQASDSELPNRPPPTAAAPAPVTDRLALSAAAASSWGALPRLGLGLELQLAWMRDWLRIALGVAWFPLRSMQVADDSRASFGMYFAEVLLCGQQRVGSAQLFGCATAAAGRMAAHADGPGPMPTESTSWRAVGAALGASYPLLPPLELTASITAWVPFTRPRFYVVPSQDLVHEPAPVVAQFLLGLLFSL